MDRIQRRINRLQADRLLVAAMWFNMTGNRELLEQRVAAIVPGAAAMDVFIGGAPDYPMFYMGAGADDAAKDRSALQNVRAKR